MNEGVQFHIIMSVRVASISALTVHWEMMLLHQVLHQLHVALETQ